MGQLRQDRFREANQLSAWIEVEDGRSVQTVGGRTGVPFPRLTHRSPFLAWHSSTAWTTLELILNADGRAEGRLLGASPFPCPFVYGPDGELAAETGATDFRTWFSTCFGRHTPWGGRELEPLALNELASALPRAS
ncbi:MAG TPA: hypothetical protein VKF14_03690 [Candidatus Dormibacteraeota bacterium]|nr:hypothetical protein [Candidatus Dormibacteraeota bacterium]